MKAKEYFDKYHKQIFEVEGGRTASLPGSSERVVRIPKTDEEMDDVLNRLYLDLRNELTEMVKTRKIQTDRAFLAAVNEINDKYNAIADLFEKEYGWTPIRRNGFRTAIHMIVKQNADKRDAKDNGGAEAG